MDMPEPRGYWSSLCNWVIDWDKNGKTGDFPDGGTLVRNGPTSIVFVPEKESNCIIKVVKPGLRPLGLSPQEEFGLLEKLQELKGEYFVTPTPLSWGNDPPYIAMEKLGTAVNEAIFSADPNEAKRIGTALGEFAGRLYLKNGAIHTDLASNNYTFAPDGKIGIIDIASVEKTDVPEKMFQFPALNSPRLCAAMADKFDTIVDEYNKSRKDGKKVPHINIDMVEKLSLEWLSHNDPKFKSDYEKAYTSNLREWRNLRDEGDNEITCHRPRAKHGISNPRRDI